MTKNKPNETTEIMVVNDAPGEECRIAILEEGHLEELYTERAATATGVGNIYKGRITRVEPAIQAAFVDYGKGASGFLHISDLHPRYFPRGDKTERVGKRTARRDRPLIQEALKSGQEVLVQVLKEGIGTKGPTLTSYLSIPGRLIVMMPDMDRVGVSRKVEDEEKRRKMRQILDGLDLPDGFGFILRTAGFDRTKTDLKRDVAYLMRLWKVMEQRMTSAGTPCELYTESDLLIRTIRDVTRTSINAIVVDSKSAYDRATSFLRVVAPRSAPNVVRYRGNAPIFHAFDVERQIELIHSRDVPLPSGGHLVIEQTEALVAIDVNSGRSRGAHDSESNAFHTNCEAVDEISRQLRLRDLGGLIINDLIDMRAHRHRKEIEERFRNNLKRDRARWTVTNISEFGVLEMTRQRMRPSLRKSHYMPCPSCEGHGEVKIPETIGSDAARHIAYLLQFDRVKRVELVCSAKVASVLLSRRRRSLVKLEEGMNKTIDVRVSESIPVDRVDYYAYDDRGADIDISRLPALRTPTIQELERAEREHEKVTAADDGEESRPARSGRRRRRGKPGADDERAKAKAEAATGAESKSLGETGGSDAAKKDGQAAEESGADAPKGRRRRRRRRGRRGDERGESAAGATVEESPIPESAFEDDDEPADLNDDAAGEGDLEEAQSTSGESGSSNGELKQESDAASDRPRRRRRRRGRRGGGQQPAAEKSAEPSSQDKSATTGNQASASDGGEATAAKKKRSRRRRRKTGGATGDSAKPTAETASVQKSADSKSNSAVVAKSTNSQSSTTSTAPAPAKRRTLYRNRTRVSQNARAAAEKSDE